MGQVKRWLKKMFRRLDKGQRDISQIPQSTMVGTQARSNTTITSAAGTMPQPKVVTLDKLDRIPYAQSADGSYMPRFTLVGSDSTFNAAVPPEYFEQWMTMLINVLTYYLYADPSERPNRTFVRLMLDNMDGVAYTVDDGCGRDTHLSTNYIATIPQDKLYYGVSGVCIHEFTHVMQNDCRTYSNCIPSGDAAPSWVLESVADYVRLRSGCADPNWTRQFNSYTNGYSEGAYFLDYLENRFPGFVRGLNQKMANPWSDDFFMQLSGGESVDQLWEDYKVSYGH